MPGQYHILNGDALKEQFPNSIQGEIIIARECLVDGNVEGLTLPALFQNRAQYLSNTYPDITEQKYFTDTVVEIKKILNFPDQAEIYLWFEDDLFCQVNLWFIINLIHQNLSSPKLFLIRPETHTKLGFGQYNRDELHRLFLSKIALTSIDKLSELWPLYQRNALAELLVLGESLSPEYSFILPAIKAHLDQIPKDGFPGRPIQSLKQIMLDLNTIEFGPVFRVFCEKESIYGFGDLHVRRLFDEIINNP